MFSLCFWGEAGRPWWELTALPPAAIAEDEARAGSTGADWAIFPLSSPGLVSIPLSFFVGWLVSIMTKPDNFEELSAEMEVRSLTGVGVEAPVQH